MRDQNQLSRRLDSPQSLNDGVVDESIVEVVFGLIDQQRVLALQKQDRQNRRTLLAGRQRERILPVTAVLQLDTRQIDGCDQIMCCVVRALSRRVTLRSHMRSGVAFLAF